MTPPRNAPLDPPQLSDLLAYLRAPRFTRQRDRVDAAALLHLGRLFMVCFSAMFLLSPFLGAIISGALGEVPENALSETRPEEMLLYGVALAPLIEEIIFRSWMGGPRAALIGLPILAGALALMGAIGTPMAGFPQLLLAAILAVLILQLAGRVWSASDASRRNVLDRVFPIIVWAGTLVFGLVHLSNYADGLSHPVMLLAVLPQTLIGGVLVYVRMRYGLAAAIGFHGMYNGVFIGLALLAMQASPAGTAWLMPF